MILDLPTPRWALPLLQPARSKAVFGGRGSGKSHFFGEYVIESHIYDPTESTVCIREYQKSLDQSVKRLLEQKIQTMNAGEYFEVQDAKIKSKKGDGVITFQGMQNHTADSIKSLEGYKRAWVEEAQTLSQYSLDLLRPTIRLDNSEILYGWNPRYKTDPVDKLFRRNKPPNSIVVNVNWNQNPWFPDVLRQEMLHDFETDPDKAEHIWNGAYGNAQGSILGKYINRAIAEGRVNESCAYDPSGAPLEISSDIGFRDTASWWFWQRKVGGFSLVKYIGASGLDADDWIIELRRVIEELGCKKLGKIYLPHDARAKTFQSKHSAMEKFLQAFGPQYIQIVPQSRKSDQINAARAVISRCEFNVDACEAGLDGLSAWEFEYNEDTQDFSKEPLHNWASHPSDSFAYGCQIMQEEVMKIDKQARGLSVGANTATLNELWKTAPPKTSRI